MSEAYTNLIKALNPSVHYQIIISNMNQTDWNWLHSNQRANLDQFHAKSDGKLRSELLLSLWYLIVPLELAMKQITRGYHNMLKDTESLNL